MWLNVKASSFTVNSYVLSSRRTLYIKIWHMCVKDFFFQRSIMRRNNKIFQSIVFSYLIFTYLIHLMSNLELIFCIEFWYNILVWILILVEVVRHLCMLFMARIKMFKNNMFIDTSIPTQNHIFFLVIFSLFL